MVNPQGENMARALDKKSGNMHIIILSVYYSLFFLLTDYGISVNASVIALTVLLFGYFVFNIKDFLHCTLTVPIAILIISVFTVLLNIRSLDYIKNNPMYLYSMIVAAVSIFYWLSRFCRHQLPFLAGVFLNFIWIKLHLVYQMSHSSMQKE